MGDRHSEQAHAPTSHEGLVGESAPPQRHSSPQVPMQRANAIIAFFLREKTFSYQSSGAGRFLRALTAKKAKLLGR